MEYMEAAGVSGITTESARRIGVLSLSRRITTLNRWGYTIRKEWLQLITRWGITRVRRYVLTGKPNKPTHNRRGA